MFIIIQHTSKLFLVNNSMQIEVWWQIYEILSQVSIINIDNTKINNREDMLVAIHANDSTDGSI